jgi:hypothetical protein
VGMEIEVVWSVYCCRRDHIVLSIVHTATVWHVFRGVVQQRRVVQQDEFGTDL